MRKFAILAVVGVAVLVAGCGGSKKATTTTTVTTTAPSKPTAAVYLERDGKVAPVRRSFPNGASKQAFLAAIEAGPTPEEQAIGFSTPTGRVKLAAQVYTLSQYTPAVPIVIGGKGYYRANFEDLTPTILVETPLPLDAVSSPLPLQGTANTFEATFEYQLLDPAGKIVSHGVVTASSGSGTRGVYITKVPFEAPNGLDKLVVFERSAADGSKIHQVEIPLSLAR
jgi:hypothetical protein